MTTTEKIQKNYKALIAFVVPFAGLLGLVASNDAISSQFPAVSLWLTVVGIPAVTAFATWLKRNEPTVQEALEIYKRAQNRAGETQTPSNGS